MILLLLKYNIRRLKLWLRIRFISPFQRAKKGYATTDLYHLHEYILTLFGNALIEFADTNIDSYPEEINGEIYNLEKWNERVRTLGIKILKSQDQDIINSLPEGSGFPTPEQLRQQYKCIRDREKEIIVELYAIFHDLWI